MTAERMFTPRCGANRLRMRLADDDWKKIGRGRGWHATITDLDTGVRWHVRAASCSIPECYCDAVAKRAKEAE